jgi:hypothetical protein
MAVRTDDVNSPAPNGDVNQLYGYQVLTPKENLTLGLNAGLELFKRINCSSIRVFLHIQPMH